MLCLFCCYLRSSNCSLRRQINNTDGDTIVWTNTARIKNNKPIRWRNKVKDVLLLARQLGKPKVVLHRIQPVSDQLTPLLLFGTCKYIYFPQECFCWQAKKSKRISTSVADEEWEESEPCGQSELDFPVLYAAAVFECYITVFQCCIVVICVEAAAEFLLRLVELLLGCSSHCISLHLHEHQYF